MHRVIIVGCGFAGLFAAKALRRAEVEVVVVDRTNHHLFQALLYQVTTGVLSEGDIAPPIRDVLRHHRIARVLLGEVVDIDAAEWTLMIDTLGQRTTLPYDSLIVATGASQSYFGHDEYARDGPGLKTIDDALELRGRIFGAFEMAELEPDDVARQPWLTFAIVRAGPTGVELAGQIAELSRRALRANFRRFDPASARIVLLDAVATVLPSYPQRLRGRAQRDLEGLGVELHLGTRVVGVDATGLDVEGGRIEARTKIWAAGVQASSLGQLLAKRAQASVDHAGRVQVEPDCSLPGHPEPFVVGDLMALDGPPGVAEVTLQRGHHAARTIARWLRGRAPQPFQYRDLGTMTTISGSAPWPASDRSGSRASPDGCCGSSSTSSSSPGSRTGSRRRPSGLSPSSGAAGGSGPSPSSRCSPGRVPSRGQPLPGDVPRAKRVHASTPASPRRRQPVEAATAVGLAGLTCASSARSDWKTASEKVGKGGMTSSRTASGVPARMARVTCWSHSPASGPSA